MVVKLGHKRLGCPRLYYFRVDTRQIQTPLLLLSSGFLARLNLGVENQTETFQSLNSMFHRRELALPRATKNEVTPICMRWPPWVLIVVVQFNKRKELLYFKLFSNVP